MENNDPLSVLVSSDAKSVDRQKLAELLAPYLVIDSNSKEFGFTSKFDELPGNESKIEVFLAGVKARALLFDVNDGIFPKEIVAIGIMAEGSVKSSLKGLFDNRKIKKDRDGMYSLPSHRISELAKRIIK